MRGVALLGLVVAGLAAPASADLPHYTVRDLGTLIPEGGSSANAMSPSGLVAGGALTVPGCNPCKFHAFLWDGAEMADLGGVPDDSYNSVGYAVNTLGQVAGRGEGPKGYYLPFLWLPEPAYGLPAGPSELPELSFNSQLWGINDAGQVVGESRPPDSFGPDAVLWQYDGQQWTLTSLGTLGGPWGRARAINSKGQITGQSNVPNGSLEAFLWLPEPAYGLSQGMNPIDDIGGSSDTTAINDKGEIAAFVNLTAAVWLPVPAHGLSKGMHYLGVNPHNVTGSQSNAISDDGVIVGQVIVKNQYYTNYGFVWADGQWALLDDLVLDNPGYEIIDAHGVDDQGRIAATGLPPGGDLVHALILTPVIDCPADINGDGVLDLFDFLGFQNLFVAKDPRADFNHDGLFDLFDFLEFQNAFVAGCP
jgi:uncharacterized membrane protein